MDGVLNGADVRSMHTQMRDHLIFSLCAAAQLKLTKVTHPSHGHQRRRLGFNSMKCGMDTALLCRLLYTHRLSTWYARSRPFLIAHIPFESFASPF